MDYVEVFKRSYSWLRDPKAWLYLALMVGLNLAITVTIGAALLGGIGAGIASLTTTGSSTTALALGGATFVFFLLASVIVGLAMTYVDLLALRYAITTEGVKVAPFDLKRFLYAILLCIAQGVTSVLCLFELRYLAAGIVGALLLVFSITSGFWPLALLAALGLVIYVFGVAYHAVRLMLSQTVFLIKGSGVRTTLKDTWRMVGGHTAQTFVAVFVVTCIWLVVVMVISALTAGLASFILAPAIGLGMNYVYAYLYRDFTGSVKGRVPARGAARTSRPRARQAKGRRKRR